MQRNYDWLVGRIRAQRSFLCVGLDPDRGKIPPHLLNTEDPVFEFNKAIIDATKAFCVAYKPNWAFYEALGIPGLAALKKTLDYIPDTHLKLADAKRGDIGNSATKYAVSIYDYFGADACTVSPYMGRDSVAPFVRENKWAISLALTSNEGGADFQLGEGDAHLFETVVDKLSDLYSPDQVMFVVGATRPEYFKMVRQLAPRHFLLVPGVGAQGGTIEGVCRYGMSEDIGLLINSSRGIIYASDGRDFAEAAGEKARMMTEEMRKFL